jgi:F-type H+-transporting ATPase subunit a
MDFNNKVYCVIKIFNCDVWITETIVNTWIVSFVLILFAIIVNLMIKNFKDVPKGFQNFIEIIVEAIDNMTKTNIGEKYFYFGGFFFGLFAFLLTSNLSGLFGLRPPTADIATTLMLALVTFVLIHTMGILKSKKKYFKDYLEPYAFLLPINIISELATPISLSFRLFGNIFGGFVIMGMVYELFPTFLKFGLPGVLHIYFDVFAGVLQSFIFIVLSMVFIKSKLPE